MIHALSTAATEGRLVVFVGAGISTIPPTSLPSWWDVNERVIVALADRSAPLIGPERSAELARTVSARQRADQFPPEYQAELLASRLGTSYFRVLQCLDSDRPNAVHLRLAGLGRAGHLAAIVTTNFDRAMEAAFHAIGAPLRTCARAAEFDALAPELERGMGRTDGCVLLKLHGSAADPTTLIDTLAQRKRGLPGGAVGCLRILLHTSHWVFLGWSGADLDANESYLGLAAAAENGRGFTWLYRTAEKPRPSVARICEAYGDRATIVHGELPDWLDLATAPLLPGLPAVHDEIDPGERSRQAQDQVASHARRWTEEIGTTASALGLADVLVAVGEPRSAIDLLRSGLQALPEPDRDGKDGLMLAVALGGKLVTAGDDGEALELYERAIEVLEARGDFDRAAEVRGDAGLIYQSRGDFPAARTAFEGTLKAAERSGDEGKRSVALHNLALVHGALGEYDQGERLFRQEIEILQRLGDEPNEAVACSDLGNLLAEASRFDAAVEVLDQAVRIRERLGNDRGRAMSLGNLARVHFGRGDLEAASRIYREVIPIFLRLGDEPSRLTTVGNLGVASVRQGRPEEAIPLLREAVSQADAMGRKPEGARLRMNLGEALREAGHPEAACEVLEQSAAISEGLGAAPARAEALLELGIIRLKLHQLDDAERAFREVLGIWDSLKQEAGTAGALMNLGLVEQERGRLDEALTLLQRSTEIHARLGQQAAVVNGKLNLGNIALLQQQPDVAAEFYTSARDLADDLKLPLQAFGASAALAFALGHQGKVGATLAAFHDAEDRVVREADLQGLADRLKSLAELYEANGHEQVATAFTAEAARMRGCIVRGISEVEEDPKCGGLGAAGRRRRELSRQDEGRDS